MSRMDEIAKRLDDVCTKRGLELHDARETFNGHAEADIDFLLHHCERLKEMVLSEQLWRLSHEAALKEIADAWKYSGTVEDCQSIAEKALTESS